MKAKPFTAPELTVRSLVLSAYVAAKIEQFKSINYATLYQEVNDMMSPKEYDQVLSRLKRIKMVDENKNFVLSWREDQEAC